MRNARRHACDACASITSPILIRVYSGSVFSSLPQHQKPRPRVCAVRSSLIRKCDAGDTIVCIMPVKIGSRRPCLRFRAGTRNSVDVVVVRVSQAPALHEYCAATPQKDMSKELDAVFDVPRSMRNPSNAVPLCGNVDACAGAMMGESRPRDAGNGALARRNERISCRGSVSNTRRQERSCINGGRRI